jgi:hypothetical protein
LACIPELTPGLATLLFAIAGPFVRPNDAFRVTTGRDMLRAGGMAAGRPAFAPSIAPRFGVTPAERETGAVRIWLGVKRAAVRCTGKPFCNVRDGTAVKAPGLLKFAK